MFPRILTIHFTPRRPSMASSTHTIAGTGRLGFCGQSLLGLTTRHVLGLPRGSLPQARCRQPAQVSSHAISGQSPALRPVKLSGIAVVFNSNHLLLASASLQHRDQQPDSLRLLHRQRPSLIDQVADKRAGKVVDSPLRDRFLQRCQHLRFGEHHLFLPLVSPARTFERLHHPPFQILDRLSYKSSPRRIHDVLILFSVSPRRP